MNSCPTPKFLTKNQVLFVHKRQIEKFGGSYGILNEGALDSAINQPKQQFSGSYLHPTLEAQASAYLFYINKAHAFVDGNKRTSIAAAEFFLRKNGYYLKISTSLAYNTTIAVATDQCSREYLTDIIARHMKPLSSHPYLARRHLGES